MADEFVGTAEVAAMGGVSRQAVANWRARYPDFPRPRAELQSGPVYRRSDIQMWLRQRKRLIAEEMDTMAIDSRPRPRILRHFLYADPKLIDGFVAQLEGGLYEQEQVDEHFEGGRGVGGFVDAKVAGVGAHRHSVSGVDSHREIHQVVASQFDRLYEAMGREDMLQSLDAFDDEIWDQVRTSEIIEVPVTAEVTGFENLLGLAAKMPLLEPFIRAAEKGNPDATDLAGTMRAVSDFTSFASQAALNLIAVPTGNPHVRLLCRLQREHVGTEPLEGEMTLLAKVQRKLRRGERVSGIQTPAISHLSKQKQREFAQIFDASRTGGIVAGANSIGFPGAVVTTIALYR
ncbi:MAG: hypothetical protein WB116_04155 [Candidatus Dormiibacterota bacterium]